MSTHTATQRRSKVRPPVTPPPEPSHSDGEASGTTTQAFLDPATRNEMVSCAAYFRAERRGFAEGCALQDWLEAEAEIDAKFGR
jgi:DUF2934 family protein